jgi:hypothetical protein
MSGHFSPRQSLTIANVVLEPGEHREITIQLSQGVIRGKLVPPEGAFPPGTKLTYVPDHRAGPRAQPLHILASGYITRSVSRPAFPMPHDIASWDLDRVLAHKAAWKQSPEGIAYLKASENALDGKPASAGFEAEEDGTFTIENLPAGDYDLHGTVHQIHPRATDKKFQITQSFHLADGQDLDLGDLVLEPILNALIATPRPKSKVHCWMAAAPSSSPIAREKSCCSISGERSAALVSRRCRNCRHCTTSSPHPVVSSS